MVATLAVVATVAFGVTWYLRRQAVRQRQTAVLQAKQSHKLVQDLLTEVRENLSPTEKKDASLMAKLSERVTSHYENLRLQDDSDEVRAQHAQSLMALCQSFAKIRDFDRAARLANEVVQIRGDIYGPEDPSIAEALLEAGRARDQMSDYADGGGELRARGSRHWRPSPPARSRSSSPSTAAAASYAGTSADTPRRGTGKARRSPCPISSATPPRSNTPGG